MEQQTYFDCLERRIRADFSDQLIFSHAMPSPIPPSPSPPPPSFTCTNTARRESKFLKFLTSCGTLSCVMEALAIMVIELANRGLIIFGGGVNVIIGMHHIHHKLLMCKLEAHLNAENKMHEKTKEADLLKLHSSTPFLLFFERENTVFLAHYNSHLILREI
ncbi:hypothetical protein HS088_TW02G00334 [Tripterygium wilfordii]|uniref:Uncharacterized protein n=1 Tax=Tripterygium wilfordii TaxID=458696 RepID=A0A7J7DYI1_TRIWF|nr:hypothetical protein HS088_TW02G00334 [Tripterygium wilfordii]